MYHTSSGRRLWFARSHWIALFLCLLCAGHLLVDTTRRYPLYQRFPAPQSGAAAASRAFLLFALVLPCLLACRTTLAHVRAQAVRELQFVVESAPNAPLNAKAAAKVLNCVRRLTPFLAVPPPSSLYRPVAGLLQRCAYCAAPCLLLGTLCEPSPCLLSNLGWLCWQHCHSVVILISVPQGLYVCARVCMREKGRSAFRACGSANSFRACYYHSNQHRTSHSFHCPLLFSWRLA